MGDTWRRAGRRPGGGLELLAVCWPPPGGVLMLRARQAYCRPCCHLRSPPPLPIIPRSPQPRRVVGVRGGEKFGVGERGEAGF